ncbi:MAG: molybdenum cofactor guanylyltransferase [Nitrospirota bacterium]
MFDSLIPVSAVILAGGENRRMRTPKAFITIGGIPIIERQAAALAGWGWREARNPLPGLSGPGVAEPCAGGARGAFTRAKKGVRGAFFDELLVIAKDPAPYESLGFKALPDDPEFSGQRGPLVGIYTGLKAAKNPFILAVACDMPFISGALARRLAELRERRDAVVPVIKGYPEPLFAVYSRTALEHADRALRDGRPRLQGLFNGMDVLYVSEEEVRDYDPELLSFVNVNTPEELKMAESLAKERQKCR